MTTGNNLIFLIALPRSGSTLLQRILAAHADIFSTAEPWLMLHPLYALRTRGISAEYGAEYAHQGLTDFLAAIHQNDDLYVSAIRNMANTLYDKALEVSGKRYFLDKTPRYHNVLPELYRTFPDAKYIFLLRNPLGVFASVMATWFKGDFNALRASLNYRDLVEGPSHVAAGMKLLSRKARVVHYEDLVHDPATHIKALCDWLDIPFHEKLLDYGNFPAPSGRFGDTKSVHQHRRPVKDYAASWQSYFAPPDRRVLAQGYLDGLGHELLMELGYDYAEIMRTLLPVDDVCEQEARINMLNDQPETALANEKIMQGEAYFSQGKVQDAIGSFKTVLDMDPSHVRAHSNLGVVYWQSGERENAILHLHAAHAADPGDVTALLNILDVYVACGLYAEASALAANYLREYPAEGELLAYLQKTVTTGREQAAQSPEAEGIQATHLPDQDGLSPIERTVLDLILHGEERYASGDTLGARAAFQAVLDIYPENVRAHGNLAVIFWQAKEGDKAVEHWKVAFRADPRDRTVVLNFGEALESVGQHAAARHVYGTYSKLIPDDREIADLLRLNQALSMSVAELAVEFGESSATHGQPLLTTLGEKDFADYTYSKNRHFGSLAAPFFHRDKRKDNCDLKVCQDTVIFNFLLSNLPRGARVLEIGGGHSRIIEALHQYFECWNLDKFEGNGNGPTVPKIKPGTHLVKDYLGNFNRELPDNYFDCVYSISTLEHVPEDAGVFKNITEDIRRVLRPNGYSVHCFDIVLKSSDKVWTNGLLHHFFKNEKTINPWVDFAVMAADPDIYVLSEEFYNQSWQAVTGKTYQEFGKPLSYNILWRK